MVDLHELLNGLLSRNESGFFSISTESGDAVTVTFPFSFVGEGQAYLRESDIRVFVRDSDEGSETYNEFTEVLDELVFPTPNTVTLTTVIAATLDGENNVYIRRIMPKDTIYADVETDSIFRKTVLNNSFLQMLYTVHESLDGILNIELLAQEGDIQNKMDKQAGTVDDEIVLFTAGGNSKKSGVTLADITEGSSSFSTVAGLAAGGLANVGDTAFLTDRGLALVTVVAGGTPDGKGILDASNGNTAVIDRSSGELLEAWYSDTLTTIGSTINYLVAQLNQSGIAATGGIVNLPFGNVTLDETVIIHNPSHTFNLDSLNLKGSGRHSTIIDASGVAGNAMEMRLGLYNIIEGFTIEGSQGNGLFIDDGLLNDEPSSNSSLKDMVFKDNTGNGVYVGRSFVMSYYDLECLSNVEAGLYFDFRIHTSQLVLGAFTRSNGGAGVRAEYLIYSAFISCASDENLYGFLMSGLRGVGSYACGAESNRRSGWQYSSNISHEINWCSGTSLVAVNNNIDFQGDDRLISFANHTQLTALNGITNFVALRQPVSLTSATQDRATKDFIAQGRGSQLVLVDPYMENAGTKAEVDGHIQIVYQAPKLIYQLGFTKRQSRTLLLLKNQNGLTADWSGKLLITVSNAMFGSVGVIGTATYELMVSKSLNGTEEVLVSSLGLINGANATHPSFVFTVFAGGLFAQALSQTAGDFWFSVEKIAGNLMWNE